MASIVQGDVLSLQVGGAGSVGKGGYNGGGSADWSGDQGAGGGGGATGLVSSKSKGDILIAGGGGGAGGPDSLIGEPLRAGAGGGNGAGAGGEVGQGADGAEAGSPGGAFGSVGGDGGNIARDEGGKGGKGSARTAGGGGGGAQTGGGGGGGGFTPGLSWISDPGDSDNGSRGKGGNGITTGGGGGGGYFGGGAGSLGAGGGAGSSYAAPRSPAPKATTDTTGTPAITFSYPTSDMYVVKNDTTMDLTVESIAGERQSRPEKGDVIKPGSVAFWDPTPTGFRSVKVTGTTAGRSRDVTMIRLVGGVWG
ncbi:hypothetical protein [Streptomyces sp. NPDC057910]|uniref:hypothetical protein n=1 Tax=Streptomyces sp. NPDC057910 TaxID=3346278 RepID=UPI0036EAEBAD